MASQRDSMQRASQGAPRQERPMSQRTTIQQRRQEQRASGVPSTTSAASSPNLAINNLASRNSAVAPSPPSAGAMAYSSNANVHPSQGPARGTNMLQPPPSSQSGHRPYNRTATQWSSDSRTATTSSSSLNSSLQKRGQFNPNKGSTLRDSTSIAKHGQPDLEWMEEEDDEEEDDGLHAAPLPGEKVSDTKFTFLSFRGLLNVMTLLIVVCGLLTLFAGYPLIAHFTGKKLTNQGAYGLGGTNGTGQIPAIMPSLRLVDDDTPDDKKKWTSPINNDNYHLVFSDEFNEEGRTFWPGDDPFWEAVDIWYGATGDFEWYSPEQANTTDGYLLLAFEQKPMHDLNFRSGMLQSWNKFCFQGGYIEFNAVLPGSPEEIGWWPAMWMQGNLARPGYLGTTDGMWPYSYQACDSGILHNQTRPGSKGYDDVTSAGANGLSFLPGMRTPSCTCEGEDHPGPNVNFARSAPELDVLEAQVKQGNGVTSQSLQTAPFDLDYEWDQDAGTIHDTDNTQFNTYKGKVYQESASSITNVPLKAYARGGDTFTTFGVEWVPDFKNDGTGSVTWYLDDTPSWTVTGAAFPPRPDIDISQRFIPSEPMSIVMNLGMARSFQPGLDFDTINFPGVMKIDYVRLYQPDSYKKDLVSCDPDTHPTADYINRHMEVYTNPNHTTWPKNVPKNKLTTGC